MRDDDSHQPSDSAERPEPAATPAPASARPHPRPTPARPRPQPRPQAPPPAPAGSAPAESARADSAPAESTPTGFARTDSARTEERPDTTSARPASHRSDEPPRRRGPSWGGVWRRVRRPLLRFGIFAAVAVAAVVLLRVFVVAPYYIPSASMEPTLHGCSSCDDDHVLVERVSYHLHDPRRGDVVVFSRPPSVSVPEKVLIKRVIAIGGDTVTLRNGRVVRNGTPLQEDYVNKACGAHPTRPLDGRKHWIVPDGDVFVMGDNRCDSIDSRAFGPVPVSSITGRAWLIFWPLGRLGGV